MLKIFSVIKKEILEIFHDRTMIAVLIIFPIFIMLFMGSSFRTLEINGLPVGIVEPESSEFSAVLLSGLNESAAFKLIHFGSEEGAMEDFRNGKLKAVILVPGDFENDLKKGNGSEIRIIVDNSDLALEQSVIAAMSAVVQASSADITVSYVSAAWNDLYSINKSAGELAESLSESRAEMQKTKESLAEIQSGMQDIDTKKLKSSLAGASANTIALKTILESQKQALASSQTGNLELLEETDAFLMNASYALNESIETVEETHSELEDQIGELEQTKTALDSSIAGLNAVKAMVNDSITITALNINIASLQALKDATSSQIARGQQETARLESLNSTLQDFRMVLSNYSGKVQLAKSANTSMDLSELDQASAKLDEMNATFSEAEAEIDKLDSLLTGVGSTLTQINSTLEKALSQTSSVDNLISQLDVLVSEQTAKDPKTIASPLSIAVENQYQRASFVDFLMPQVIAISLLFSCFLLASISLVREKTGYTIVRALMTPGGLANLTAGKIATMMIMSVVQVVIIMAVALAIFGVGAPADLLMLVFGVLVASLVLSSIGTLIGFYARTESAAIQTCLLIAIPMLFLGNIIFSPDLLPSYTRFIQELLPLAHVTNIFKIILITGGNPIADIAALGIYFVLLTIVLVYILAFRKDISNFQ